MLIGGWMILGGLVGLGLEPIARRVAAAPARGGTGRLPLLALGLAAVFALLASRYPLGAVLIVTSAYAAVLGLVTWLDLRHRLVYPVVTYPTTLLALALTPLVLGGPLWSGLAGALAGAGVFMLFYLAARRVYRTTAGLGFGDVMIAGLIGAMVGWPSIGGALLLGTIFGGLGGAVIGLARRSRRAAFAYGPALCLGALVVLLNGPGG